MEKIKFNFEVPHDPYIEVYDPEGELVIRTNDEKMFLYICCQIKNAKAEGYYVVIPEEIEKMKVKNPDAEVIKYPIRSTGRVTGAGGKMFHVYAEMLRKLIL